MPAQIRQKHELVRTQVQDLVTAGSLAADEIQLQVQYAEAGRIVACGNITPHEIAQSCQQFCQRKRLGQVVVPTLFQASDPVVDRPSGGKNQYRAADAGTTKLKDQVNAILIRKSKVDDQNVILPLRRKLDCGLAIRCGIHLVARTGKRLLQESLNFGFILDQQKSHESW
jgi:hypothetical protein